MTLTRHPMSAVHVEATATLTSICSSCETDNLDERVLLPGLLRNMRRVILRMLHRSEVAHSKRLDLNIVSRVTWLSLLWETWQSWGLARNILKPLVYTMR
jgi:hypothetical protein